jgi:hypothetical protein
MQITVSWPTQNSFVTQISVAIHRLINAKTVCRIYMKLSTWIPYEKVRKGEFNERRLSDSHTFLMA